MADDFNESACKEINKSAPALRAMSTRLSCSTYLSVVRVMTTLYLPLANNCRRSSNAAFKVTVSSRTLALPMAPGSWPPWPGSITIIGFFTNFARRDALSLGTGIPSFTLVIGSPDITTVNTSSLKTWDMYFAPVFRSTTRRSSFSPRFAKRNLFIAPVPSK